MNSSSQQRMDLLLSLINVKLFSSFDGRPSARTIVFLFLVFTAFSCGRSHLFFFFLTCFLFHAYFVFQTLVCVGSPLPAKALMEK